MNCLYCEAPITKVVTKKQFKDYLNRRGVNLANFYRKNKTQELLLCQTCGKYQARLRHEIQELRNENNKISKDQKLTDAAKPKLPENWSSMNALQKLAWIDNELEKQGYTKW